VPGVWVYAFNRGKESFNRVGIFGSATTPHILFTAKGHTVPEPLKTADSYWNIKRISRNCQSACEANGRRFDHLIALKCAEGGKAAISAPSAILCVLCANHFPIIARCRRQKGFAQRAQRDAELAEVLERGGGIPTGCLRRRLSALSASLGVE
jgi:hypothetical protein